MTATFVRNSLVEKSLFVMLMVPPICATLSSPVWTTVGLGLGPPRRNSPESWAIRASMIGTATSTTHQYFFGYDPGWGIVGFLLHRRNAPKLSLAY